ncbi:ferrochelatase [Legionella sp. W05-934-2]|jgi:ferrochelatase|uniref:ferrochelatase n=1 Tax=Legionella sp. W05-934-2 TaxID=1198649 RepID=UPI0034629DA1
MKRGLLLVNLGTPDSPNRKDVRRYLKQFLSDPYVLDLPKPIRLALLYCLILPFRPKQSAHAYQQIWQENGSPLLAYSLRLKEQLQEKLGQAFQVALGMRYGQPSIESALKNLMDCQSITVLPLYPQYSRATTESTIQTVYDRLSVFEDKPKLTIIRDFYNHPGFIEPMAALIKPHLETHDHLLLSYHGLPTRQIMKSGCQTVCEGSCPNPKLNQQCYRSQCFATSRAIADALSLKPNEISTSFQSRLGRTPWIQPYTDEQLRTLVNQGSKNLLIACPSFTTDCLETLEEIGIRGQELWLALGGEKLTLVPCVNDSPAWVAGIESIISQ